MDEGLRNELFDAGAGRDAVVARPAVRTRQVDGGWKHVVGGVGCLASR